MMRRQLTLFVLHQRFPTNPNPAAAGLPCIVWGCSSRSCGECTVRRFHATTSPLGGTEESKAPSRQPPNSSSTRKKKKKTVTRNSAKGGGRGKESPMSGSENTTRYEQTQTPSERLREQQGKGVLRDCFVKPFPVRCAFEVGTGGVVSLSVARVDANQNAIRDMLYNQQLPLKLESKGAGFDPATGQPLKGRILAPDSVEDLTMKLSCMLMDLQLRQYGISEYVGLLTWPFADLLNAEEIRFGLTKKLKVQFHIAGRPLSNDLATGTGTDAAAKTTKGGAGGGASSAASMPTDHLDRLSFDAFAANANVLNKYNFVTITESSGVGGSGSGVPGGGVAGAAVHLTGLLPGDEEAMSKDGVGAPGTVRRWSTSLAEDSDRLVRFTIPIGTYHAHRLLITEIQRRNEQQYHIRSSPNPVLRSEFIQCRETLTKMISALLPPWVNEKSKLGCVFATSSPNGGIFNVGARASGRVQMSLETMEVAAEHHYCGLTDVLIGENYPNAHLVIPQLALASSIMRSLSCVRVVYCPDVSLAHSLLIAPHYWAFAHQHQLETKLRQGAWYVGKQRTAVHEGLTPHQSHDKYSPNNPDRRTPHKRLGVVYETAEREPLT